MLYFLVVAKLLYILITLRVRTSNSSSYYYKYYKTDVANC